MTTTELQKENARKIIESNNFNELYINEKGEYFNNLSYAELSVGYDKEKVMKFNIDELFQKNSE